MENKTYEITINLPKQQVWDIMFGDNTYPQWIKGFSENSDMVGEWKEGTDVDFIDVDQGGTRGKIELLNAPNEISIKHIAVLDKDRNVVEDGMENWIGTVEAYLLEEIDGKTHLTINMHYHPDFEQMLDDGWNKSLKLLKELCEK